MGSTSYAIALGSNRRTRRGSPQHTLRAAADTLGVDRLSSVRATAALGSADRSFANAVAILRSCLDPLTLLIELKALERDFGRRAGRRWGPRALDLDIILWSEGPFAADGLVIPHPEFRGRRFVLDPLAELAPDWRDPISGHSVRQLRHRLRRSRPVDRRGRRA